MRSSGEWRRAKRGRSGERGPAIRQRGGIDAERAVVGVEGRVESEVEIWGRLVSPDFKLHDRTGCHGKPRELSVRLHELVHAGSRLPVWRT